MTLCAQKKRIIITKCHDDKHIDANLSLNNDCADLRKHELKPK